MSGLAEPGPPRAIAAGGTDPASLARIDRALIGLRHLWSTPPHVQDQALGSIDMSTIWIVDALSQVEESGEPGTSDRGLTIGELALALGVAPSTASRLVARAQDSGAIFRHPSQSDARMVAVRLSGPGRELARTSRAFRGRHLDRVTAGWTDIERSTFADLLSRFADSVGAMEPRT